MRIPVQFAAACLCLNAPASSLTLQEGAVRVTLDEASNTFSAAAAPDQPAWLVAGLLENAAPGARERPARDPVFGAGKGIAVPLAGGGEASLEVYPDLPFLVVRTTRANPGAEELVLNKAVPAAFTLDLGKPAANLRTMGTAGLTAPDKHPGSYLFLTLADPATRRGVVAGWLTHERGSGVVFSDVKDGRVEFRAQIDYGALRIPAGKSAVLETLLVGAFDDARLGEEAFAAPWRSNTPSSCTRRSTATAPGTPTATAARATRNPSSNWPRSPRAT
ncbi:MAG: hypothetical protein U1G05_06500 [Kiritimatiellia bacterium]